jgi:tetratricopeptide (TPR) repeat protein
LDLDETLAEAHCTLGLIKIWYELDWDGAEREFQVALELDPSHITALIWQSLYLAVVGRHRESVESVQRAREIEPLSATVNLYLGLAHSNAGQFDLAIRQIRQTIELDPGFYRSHLFLGMTLNWAGRHDEAIPSFQRALSLSPDNLEALAFMGVAVAAKGDRQRALAIVQELIAAESRTEPAIMIAVVYARLKLANEMYQWLERGVAVKSTPIYLGVLLQEFHSYRADPRYHRFLKSIGLSHLART